MITDITGIELTPGENGANCAGNGAHFTDSGALIECCCDECDYLQCCFAEHSLEECAACGDADCPRSRGGG